MFRKTNVSANVYPNVQASVPVVTTTLPRINPDITMVSESPVASLASTWITPKLPEMVAKESPSGILANLTPMKTAPPPPVGNAEVTASSPAEAIATPSNIASNPFAKTTDENQTTANSEGNAMLDYISTMMKLNGNSNNNNNNNKKKSNSNLSSSAFPNNS